MDHSKLKKSLTAPSFVKPSSPRHPSDYRLPTCCEKHFSPWCPLTHQLPAGSVWTGFGLPCPPSLIPEMGSLGLKGQALCSSCRLPLSRWQKGRDVHFPFNSRPLWPAGAGMQRQRQCSVKPRLTAFSLCFLLCSA